MGLATHFSSLRSLKTLSSKMASSATASSFLVLPILAPKTSSSLFPIKFNVKPVSLSLSSALRTSSGNLSARFVRRVAVSSELDQEDEFLSEGDEEGEEEQSFSPDLKLFVGNLPFSVDSSQLADLFQSAGTVEMVEVIYDKETGRSRGFGFVTMSSVSEAEAAAEQLNGYELEGRALRVNYGPPPPKREVSFNRGEGGFGGSRFSGTNANKIFVSNLPWNVDGDALESFFSELGNIQEAKVIYDRESGRSKGFGFVTFSSVDEVNSAVESMDGADLDGRPIRVSVAEDRPRRSF